MGGINLNESGLDFVRQVFVTFGGNTTVLTLFLLSVLYLALKGKKEERYVFVTTAVFLAFTVYNPFAVKYILGKLGMVNVYYRFFWILPMVLTIGYACTKVVGGQKKGWRRYLTAAALAAVIIMAMQPFDMADVLLEVFSAINTVGMSTGITRDLNTVSRLILIVLMYCGRLGSLSFALVFAQKNTSDTIRLPQEKIIVG